MGECGLFGLMRAACLVQLVTTCNQILSRIICLITLAGLFLWADCRSYRGRGRIRNRASRGCSWDHGGLQTGGFKNLNMPTVKANEVQIPTKDTVTIPAFALDYKSQSSFVIRGNRDRFTVGTSSRDVA